MDHSIARTNMVDNQLRPSQITSPLLLEAMGAVPRERFVPTALRGVAYADEDLPLPGGQHLLAALPVAQMIQAADLEPAEVVLVLGCATGYTGALLARLVATVILVQPDAEAAARVETVLDDLGVDNVVVVVNPDPATGHPDQAPYDAILIVGRIAHPPADVLAQLGDGGRLVTAIDDDRIGKVTAFTRLHGVVGRRVICDAQVPALASLGREAAFAF